MWLANEVLCCVGVGSVWRLCFAFCLAGGRFCLVMANWLVEGSACCVAREILWLYGVLLWLTVATWVLEEVGVAVGW